MDKKAPEGALRGKKGVARKYLAGLVSSSTPPDETPRRDGSNPQCYHSTLQKKGKGMIEDRWLQPKLLMILVAIAMLGGAVLGVGMAVDNLVDRIERLETEEK